MVGNVGETRVLERVEWEGNARQKQQEDSGPCRSEKRGIRSRFRLVLAAERADRRKSIGITGVRGTAASRHWTGGIGTGTQAYVLLYCTEQLLKPNTIAVSDRVGG